MQRRDFLLTSLATATTPLIPGLAQAQDQSQGQSSSSVAPANSGGKTGSGYGVYSPTNGQYYDRDEIVSAGSNFLGVTVEALGGALEKIFADYGDHPTAYIAGEEASASLAVGLRYGKGNLFMKSQPTPTYIYWQGPSIGFDTGANVGYLNVSKHRRILPL